MLGSKLNVFYRTAAIFICPENKIRLNKSNQTFVHTGLTQKIHATKRPHAIIAGLQNRKTLEAKMDHTENCNALEIS